MTAQESSESPNIKIWGITGLEPPRIVSPVWSHYTQIPALSGVALRYGDDSETIITPTIFSVTQKCNDVDPGFAERLMLTDATVYTGITWEESNELTFSKRAKERIEGALRVGETPLSVQITRLPRDVVILRPLEYPWRLLAVLDRWVDQRPDHRQIYDATQEVLPISPPQYSPPPRRR